MIEIDEKKLPEHSSSLSQSPSFCPQGLKTVQQSHVAEFPVPFQLQGIIPN